MTIDGFVAWSSFAVLNLGLTILLLRVDPPRPVNRVLALMLGFNGANAGFQAGEAAGWWLDSTQLVGLVLDTPTVVALAVLPFFVPYRRLSRRSERVLWAAAAMLGLAVVGLVGAFLLGATGVVASLGGLMAGSLVWILVAIGASLLLHNYLRPVGALEREHTRFVLAAYLLKATTSLTLLLSLDDLGSFDAPVELFAYRLSAMGALAVPIVAFVVFSAVRFWRARRDPAARGTWARSEGTVLLFAGLGLALGGTAQLDVPPGSVGTFELEHMVARPLLLAVGILRFQLVPMDVRAQRGLWTVTLVAGGLGALLGLSTTLEAVGFDPGLAAGLALFTLGVLAATIGWPLITRTLNDHALVDGGRSRLVYRAALEEFARGAPGHDTSHQEVLHRVRDRLGIGEAEHAVEVASLGAAAVATGPFDVTPSWSGDVRAPAAPATVNGTGQRYHVERLLGRGGFGRAFLAHDRRLGRRVVLKVADTGSEAEARRVELEARVLARLQHPNIVTIHDVEVQGDQALLVLEHVAGGSLAQLLGAGSVDPVHAVAMAGDVLAGLAAAHGHGIIHRDVKPGNILITPDGRAKLADFGVARAPHGSGTVAGLSFGGRNPGTVRYMSPEQVRDMPVDERSDLYAVGAVLYEMLAGRPCIDPASASEFDLRLAIVNDPPAIPLPDISTELNHVLARALAKDRADRAATAVAMAAELAAAPEARAIWQGEGPDSAETPKAGERP